MPIVILEGPDGGGKSELAKELLAGPCKGWKFTHNGTYGGMKGRELFQLYTHQILEGRETGVLLDRSFDSEGIYGPVMRGEDRLGKLGRRLLNRLCSAVGAVQIICLPSKGIAELNWRSKKTDYVDELKRWNRIYDRYANLLVDPRYVRYDYEWNAGRTRKDLALRFSAIIKMQWGNFRLAEGYVGSTQAKYLFVGEQVNVKKAWADLPFFDVKGVSAYLAEVLEKAGVDEKDVAFVNALGQEGHPNRIIASRETKVIALGRKAKEVCLDQGYDDVMYLPHPNYILRFNQKRTYVRKLKAVLK